MNKPFDAASFVEHVTDEVWNRKNVGQLYDCAVANVAVHGPSGREQYGREALMTAVIGWLAAFPDTQITIEDVIWEGDDEIGYQISVRRALAGRNMNTSTYGPATGTEVSVRSLVHYVVFDGMIREIWHEFDEVGLIRQLGCDLFEVIKRVEQQGIAVEPSSEVVGKIERTAGQLPPADPPSPSGRFDAAEFARGAIHEIWNWRMVGRVNEYYAKRFNAHISGQQFTGQDEVIASVLARLATFPDLSVHLDQIIAAGDGRSGYRTATRWTMLGTHLGPSEYGPPTGKRIRLNGISHHRIWRRQFVQEWTEVGEFGSLRDLVQRPEESFSIESE
ncbi:MAG: ester cyclase [Proteobacteria bacterium]|nr:ester cyclase [Pseudomonadota bacterium]